MNVDIKLIKSIESNVFELMEITKLKVYSKVIVLERIFNVIYQLEELNKIQKEYLNAYEERKKLFFEEWARMDKAYDQLQNLIDKFIDYDYDNYENSAIPPFNEEVARKLEADLAINLPLIEELLKDHTYLTFARKRKFWLRIDKFMFKFYTAIIVIIKLIISSFLGFISATISGYFFPEVHQLLTGVIFTFLSYFTFDNLMNRIGNNYFWKVISKQVVNLRYHLYVYVNQIALISKGISKRERKSPLK